MNNGKVRIYELSKELNLDNKELLAICDELDIAVKSHSSTISETEAEQIRTAAEKLAATNVMPKKELTTSHKPNSPQIGGPSRPTAPHKQQILEIRKPKILRNTTSNAQEASIAISTEFASSEANPPNSPRPFATPVSSSMKPTAPIRPVPKNQAETPQKSPVTEAEQTLDRTRTPEKTADYKPEKTVAPRPKPEKPQRPQLVAPPARPLGETPTSSSDGIAVVETGEAIETRSLTATEKPLLKRDRDQVKPKVARQTSDQPAPDAPRIAGPGASRPTPAPVRPEQKGNRPFAPTPGAGDPQRPRPVRAGEKPAASPVATPPRGLAGVGAKQDGLDDDPVAPDLLDLKRPTPPRLLKGGKKWQEEEIIDEVKEKAGKGVTKGKRVKPILDDEFEEDLLDDEDPDSLLTVQVSLSITRPCNRRD